MSPDASGGARPAGLTRLLHPRSVAVVGATERAGSYGAQTVANLLRAGFPGPVHPVNPGRSQVFGLPCVPSLADLPGPVDAVVVATPPGAVTGVLDEAGRLGCGGAVVYAAGFAEAGDATGQGALVGAAARHGLPVLGPNCNGLVAVGARAPLWGDAVRLPDAAGPVAVVTQSGNLGVVALAHRAGEGLHTVVSVGNEAVLGAPEVVDALAVTPGVRVVAAYVEAGADGAGWARALAACAEHDVRVAVLKAGRTAAGRAAGAAHTAAVAGDHRVFAALVREAGGVLAMDVHDLLETARALAVLRRDPRGAAVLSSSGGDAAVSGDLAGDLGAALATLSDGTRAAVADLLPAGVAVTNPLDHTNAVWADTAAVRDVASAVARDAEVGHLLYVQDEPPGLPPGEAVEWAATRDGAAAGARAAGVEALLVATCPGQEPPGAVGGLRPALAAVAALQRPAPDPSRLAAIAATAREARRRAADAAGAEGATEQRALAEHEAKHVLRAHGVAVPASRTVRDPAAAATAAAELSLPVALKVSAPGLVHKSDAGALALGLPTAAAVREAGERLLALPGLPGPESGRHLLVEKMAGPGADLLVACRTDGAVPVLVLGAGGVLVEVLDDTVTVPLPVDEARVTAALSGLRIAALLRGTRGAPPLDVPALAALAVGACAASLAEGLALLELNPVRVLVTGALALDAVAVPA